MTRTAHDHLDPLPKLHEADGPNEGSGMRRVVIESPFAGDIGFNLSYARRCMADSLKRGEAPLASHLLYTQRGILNDRLPEERRLGMEAGFIWGQLADATIVYVDLGVTPGMVKGIKRAEDEGRPVEYRRLFEGERHMPQGG